jgi:integrase
MRARSVSTRPHELSVFLLFLAATGCRRGEALAIAWPDIDLINGKLQLAPGEKLSLEAIRFALNDTEFEDQP